LKEKATFCRVAFSFVFFSATTSEFTTEARSAEKIRDNQFKSDFNPLTEVIPSERSESRDLHLLYA
jgi:hypothetical protein